MRFHRYFKAEVDEEGQPIEENIVEIASPTATAILPFCIGILIGCILMTIF